MNRRYPASLGVVLLALALTLLALPGSAATGPFAAAQGTTASQPPQPSSGPGGSNYSHLGVRVSSGGFGDNAWYAFEPTGPAPTGAPLAIITHGYFEFSGYSTMRGLIEHTVRTGSVVIYPRYQTTPITACPGPFNVEPCVNSAVAGIRGALQRLREPGHVLPDVTRTSYFGFSFGGIITANMTNRWQQLGLPRPRVIFLDDPHDGGFAGPGEPALDDSLAGIPASTLFQCHVGEAGVISEDGKAGSSCNAVFPKLTHIPSSNKDLVLTYDDDHGTPALSSAHGVCAGGELAFNGVPDPSDAYDWGFCWRVWDALRNAAYEPGRHRDDQHALGDNRWHRDLGRWSDGVPIQPLKVSDVAPIRP
jgi:hypothetical protein